MNILWICTDQQRYDTLGCYGNKWVKTPNLDRLAAEGVLFERAYCQSPVCAPSRGSFLTGRYPRTCGPRQNGQDIDERERLLPAMKEQAEKKGRNLEILFHPGTVLGEELGEEFCNHGANGFHVSGGRQMEYEAVMSLTQEDLK